MKVKVLKINNAGDAKKVTKIEDESDKNAATLGGGTSFENQVAGSQQAETHRQSVWDDLTDVSECTSVVSKKDDNSCSENSNTKRSTVLVSNQNSDLDKFPSTKENVERTTIYGLLTFS